jgi:hypothetical protein
MNAACVEAAALTTIGGCEREAFTMPWSRDWDWNLGRTSLRTEKLALKGIGGIATAPFEGFIGSE